MQKTLMMGQQRENELKMNIIAYKDLVERKNEEIQMLQEQIGRMRNSSLYNMGGPNPRAGHIENNDRGASHGINVDNMIPPMCGTKDCSIF